MKPLPNNLARQCCSVARLAVNYSMAKWGITVGVLAVSAPIAFGQVQETHLRPSLSPNLVLVRGQESIVAEINMGPQATTLWKKIQAVIAEPDLTDFSTLVRVFDLQITRPVDAVDWRKSEIQIRHDIRGAGSSNLISSGRYGVGISSDEQRQKFVLFELELDVKEICLSKLEIQRVYGKGIDTWPTDQTNSATLDQTGYRHGFGLSPRPGGFVIAASGCATKFSINQAVTNSK